MSEDWDAEDLDTSLPAAAVDDLIAELVPAIKRLGIRIEELTPRSVVGVVELSAGNRNHLGTMYAGALFGVAEVIGGALILASFDLARFYPVVKDLHINYRHPAASDVRAYASLEPMTLQRLKTELDTAGKAEFELDSCLTDDAGVVVARAHGVYQVRPQPAYDREVPRV